MCDMVLATRADASRFCRCVVTTHVTESLGEIRLNRWVPCHTTPTPPPKKKVFPVSLTSLVFLVLSLLSLPRPLSSLSSSSSCCHTSLHRSEQRLPSCRSSRTYKTETPHRLFRCTDGTGCGYGVWEGDHTFVPSSPPCFLSPSCHAASKGTWQHPQGDFRHPFYLSDLDGCLLSSQLLQTYRPHRSLQIPRRYFWGIHSPRKLPFTGATVSRQTIQTEVLAVAILRALHRAPGILSQRRINCLQESSTDSTPLCT